MSKFLQYLNNNQAGKNTIFNYNNHISYLTFRKRYGELESVEMGLSLGDGDDIFDDEWKLSRLPTSFFRAVCNKSQSIFSSGVVKLSSSIHGNFSGVTYSHMILVS